MSSHASTQFISVAIAGEQIASVRDEAGAVAAAPQMPGSLQALLTRHVCATEEAGSKSNSLVQDVDMVRHEYVCVGVPCREPHREDRKACIRVQKTDVPPCLCANSWNVGRGLPSNSLASTACRERRYRSGFRVRGRSAAKCAQLPAASVAGLAAPKHSAASAPEPEYGVRPHVQVGRGGGMEACRDRGRGMLRRGPA